MHQEWLGFSALKPNGAPVAWGVRIQPTHALRLVVGGDYLRDMSYPLSPAHCMRGLLACNGAYELG